MSKLKVEYEHILEFCQDNNCERVKHINNYKIQEKVGIYKKDRKCHVAKFRKHDCKHNT